MVNGRLGPGPPAPRAVWGEWALALHGQTRASLEALDLCGLLTTSPSSSGHFALKSGSPARVQLWTLSSGAGSTKKHRDLAKAILRRKGMLGASPNCADAPGKSSVKFNKGYTALSQSPDENLVSLDSDSDGELESRYSSGYSSAEQVNQEVSQQLLRDGYHLDEIPDDEDLDLIPPKPMTSSACSCCWCCLGDTSSCTLQ
ncbi:protein FAM219B [Echinops telfairi]|uniref:Protein FAM219B n=1 Tax=Echinops telfairi TaxID=9371 RepID=A0ABM0J0G6_ECHTE|nr:protein FAM219B [Echinops telfairi]